MAIEHWHLWLYDDLFARLAIRFAARHPNISAVVIGHQEILGDAQRAYPHQSVKELFRSWGWSAIDLDQHDGRASVHFDLNQPIEFEPQVDLVFDIGTLEHVADSQMALENYLAALKDGGFLFLVTTVKGYFDHGLHTFSPEYITRTLEENGCKIEAKWFFHPEWQGGGAISNETELAKFEDGLIAVLAQLQQGFTRPLKAIQQQRWVK